MSSYPIRVSSLFLCSALICIGLSGVVAAPAVAIDRHVTTSADSGSESLRNQVDNSANGDTVIIDPGINPTLTGGIFIDESITIQGQGPAATTITGGLGTVFVVRRLFSSPVTAVISGVKVTGGHFPAPAVADGGPGAPAGGILIETGETLTINSSTITGNSAGNGANGGNGSTGSNGSAGGPGGQGGYGGGVLNAGTLTINNSTISGNSSGRGGSGGTGGTGTGTFGTGGVGGAGGAGGVGGGVASVGALTINNSTVAGNNTSGLAGDGGNGGPGGAGAFFSADGGAGGAGGAGGGLAILAGSVTVTNSTIEGNKAGDGGPGGAGPFGSVGGAGGNGGAISASPGTVNSTLNSTTVANNAAGSGGSGGGIGGPGPGGSGGGVSLGANPNPMTFTNSLLAANTAPGSGPNCTGAVADGGHNLDFPADAMCPAGFLTGDPLLGALAPNGGPTQTMALGAGSAALDQVPASGAGCPPADQRGVGRPQGPACDIGAFEREVAVSPPPAAGTTQGTAAGFDLAAAIRKCKKKFPKGPKRKKCIRKAKRKAGAA